MLNTDHNSKFLPEALTFDDILMVPAHSNVLPAASTILISYRLPERSVTLIPR